MHRSILMRSSEGVAMKFIGVDLTSAFALEPRPVDVAMLDDDRNVTFHQVVWPAHTEVVNRDPASAVAMILKSLRLDSTEPFILAVDGPQGLANPGQTQRACEQILGHTRVNAFPATTGR